MKVLSVACVALVLFAGEAASQVVDELSRRQALQHHRAGQELMLDERYERAAAEFMAAIELNPLLTLAHYGLGQAYMALRRYTSAALAFVDCREAYERIAALRQRDAAESSRLESDEINELRDSIRRLQSSQVNVDAGTRFRIEQRLEDLETLRRGRTLNDRFQIPAEVLLALGSAYFRSERLADAEREWRTAVETDPKLGEAHNNLAALYAMTGRKQEAEDAVKAAERARFRVPSQLKEDIQRMR